jgi:hypothetical protein
VGITAVLHTWDQTLKDHFHLHCLVPAGALSFDQSRWISARKNFLFPVKALSQVFRGKFLGLLQQACDKRKLPAASIEIKAARHKSWVVYAKKPFGSPPTVLDYLGRYTHRVALSNNRILQVENGEVTLSYRDRKDGDRKKIMTLEAQEFIRRFLLHVLPDGFMRIRHFGFLANRSKKQALAQCRQLLDLDPALPKSPILSAKDLLLKITGIDLSLCPCCHEGMMIGGRAALRWACLLGLLANRFNHTPARVTFDGPPSRGCAGVSQTRFEAAWQCRIRGTTAADLNRRPPPAIANRASGPRHCIP